MLEMFLQPDIWVALLTLVFLEIVLGIDNILFISIAASKLPEDQQKKATNIGLMLAMLLRVLLLFGISFLVAMSSVIFQADWGWMEVSVTGQSLVMLGGGLFLLIKSVQEIHHKVEGHAADEAGTTPKKKFTLSQAVVQIALINIVFSFDSILTAVGMTTGINNEATEVDEALIVMIIAVILSMVIMLIFANPVNKFVTKHPTIQMLGLSFLILIGFILISEGAHMAHLVVFDQTVGVIPKGYLYFTIAFSLAVEALNMKLRKSKP